MDTGLRGTSRDVVIGADQPFVIIGEKLNPTGNKKLGTALQCGDLELVRELAMRQVAWGADVLDVNVGLPGLDEMKMMAAVVTAVAGAVPVPLCIDSGNPEILQAGLAVAPGRPLVNSVNAEPRQLASILPIVRDRGAAVIGLTIGGDGIPPTAEGRLKAASIIVERAAKLGIPAIDVIIDPLAMAVGSDTGAAVVTLRTIELVRKELGTNINLGASNVSFGLPDRQALNQAFLAMAMSAGATCSITDPIKLGSTIRAADLLNGHDDHAARFIKYFRSVEELRAKERAPVSP